MEPMKTKKVIGYDPKKRVSLEGFIKKIYPNKRKNSLPNDKGT